MRRFLIMMTLLAALLLVARAAGADDTIEAPRLGPTTERPSFYDHGLWTDEAVRGSADRSRRRSAEAPRVVDERVRFTLRDYGYVAAWIETDTGDWRRIPMEYRPGADRWTIELDLPRGRTRYVFVVEDDEGRRRVRTDTANPRRRRDRDRGWVSEVEIDRRGRIVVEESRTPRRLRHERETEVHLFDDVTVGYQRVDGFRLGFRPRVEPRDPWSPRFEGDFRYGFSSERWSSRLSLVQPLTVRGRARLHLAIFDRTDTIDRTGVGAFENSLATLVFREDAYDWWRSEGVRAGFEVDVPDRLLARFELRSEKHESLERRVIAGWGGREDFLPNPAIDEGQLRSLFLRLRVGTELDHLWVQAEHADDDLLPTDFDFTRLTVQARSRLRLGRDAHLDLRARYGTTLGGTLPRQRRFLAGGIGTVRGTAYQSLRVAEASGDGYGGERLLLGNAEIVVGDDDLSFALFADAGQVWTDRDDAIDLDDLVSSVGVGFLLDEDDGLRIDVARSLEGGGALIVQARLRRPF